jgi:hypothetical protein
VILATPEQVEQYRDVPYLVIFAALREGKEVYRATLLTILEQRGIAVPESIREAPSIAPPVDEYSEALRIAETVIHWVEEQLGTDR